MGAELLSYVWPESEIAQAVIAALGVLFVAWVLVLVWSWARLSGWTRDIGKASHVRALRDRAEQGQTALREGEAASPAPARLADDRHERFASTSKKWRLSTRSPIYSHLRALYYAGLEEARLDVAELISHTSSVALKDYGLIRVTLGSFIVIGLFGTLIGLAESLALLGPALSAGLSDAAVIGSLSGLLGGLRSAFGPSIVGVALTVVGVLVFAAYVRIPVTRFRSELERATLTDWVPALYPTTSQRLTEALERSEAQMHRNFEAAERVAVFAEKIEDDIAEFGEEVEGTKATLRSLRQASADTERVSTALAEAAVQFAKAAAGVTDFQGGVQAMMEESERRALEFRGEVRETLGDMRASHLVLKKFVDDGLRPVLLEQNDRIEQQSARLSERSERLAEQLSTRLTEQNDRIAQTLAAIKAYEDAYVSEREETSATLRDLLNEVRVAYKAIAESDEVLVAQLVEQVGTPVTTTLTEELSGIREKVDVGLSSIGKTLTRIDTPVHAVAERLEGLMENFDRRMGTLITDVQNEFHKRSVGTEENTKALRELEAEIVAVLKRLDEVTSAQSGTVEGLSSSVGEVGTNVKLLSEAVSKQARSAESLQRAVERAGASLRRERRWYQRWMWWRNGRGE